MISIGGVALARELVAALRSDRALAAELRAAIGTEPTTRHVTVAQFAAARAISSSTVRAAIRDGRLPALRVGRAVRVPADAEIASKARTTTATARAAASLGLGLGGR